LVHLLKILAWPFLVVGANLWLWGLGLSHLLFSGRMKQDIAAGSVAEVVAPLSTMVLTHWSAPYTDGVRCDLPVGLRLEASAGARRGARSCTFVPAEVAAFEEDFIPNNVSSHEKYGGVSIPLSARRIRKHLRFISAD
jgi:hypothetical protein